MADQPTAAPQGDGNPAGRQPQPGFSIERIYVKDLSVENPGAPQSFQITEAPQVEIGLRTRGEQVAHDVYECVLTITVTATAAGKNVFLVEASQAGLFAIRGVPAADMQPVLAIHCPNVLFPYARETDRRRDHAHGLPAGAPGADQLRDALPAAARAGAAAGPGGHQLTVRTHARTRRVAPAGRVSRRGAARPGARIIASTAEAPTVLYDAPSAKAQAAVRLRPRRAGRSAGERRGLDQGPRHRRHHRLAGRPRDSSTSAMLLVRAPAADVRANPDEAAAVVFRAEQNVLLELAETRVVAARPRRRRDG